MPDIVVGHLDHPDTLTPVFEEFAHHNPGFQMGFGIVESVKTWLTSDRVRHIWLADGEGKVFLEKGYRTQEGDGARLPDDYAPEPVSDDIRAVLHTLFRKHPSFHEKIRTPIGAIVSRLHSDGFIGDIAGEIWLILESGLEPLQWTQDKDALTALSSVIDRYRSIGWSVKQTGSFEPVRAGDQLTVTPGAPLRAGGCFRYWWMETDASESHISVARRLRYLRDTAGGCNFSFDAFRRLPMTWYANTGVPDRPDGVNRVNSHVVNIASETSQTHYHPAIPVGGGKPQSEMYLVLDPAAYDLNTYGRQAFLHSFPDLADLSRFGETPLSPGSTLYIPPDTGHRGIDVFVNVITLPGFKPRNEIYMDRLIKETSAGTSPYNAHVTG
ncbi:MAG: hypothetical protein FJY97_14115 [candidate division Zixibacteria bacterium]|nr:hypothetical protein [candidate division Zixibacteria bacterium]